MKGVYILLILVDGDIAINIGSLGKIFFEGGFYAYVGSAQNSLEKRVARHFKKGKKKFWHIDYLLENERGRIIEVFYREADKGEECRIANKIGEANQPIKGFGSSDCRCKSHLFKLNTRDLLTKILKEDSFLKLIMHS
ncbi:MAG: GIY-YIG nuclease family protein [Candidatus Bathyarchaeia archaeon]